MPENSIIDNVSDTYVDESPIHGLGLFAQCELEIGTVLGTLDGQIVPWQLYKENPVTPEWNALPGDRLMVRPYRTKYSFINHSRTPNLEIHPDSMTLRVIRHIEQDEELTLDYRKEPLPEDYLAMPDKRFL